MSKHNVVRNDFGSVTWTPEHESALLLMNEGAAALEMTIGEFVEVMIDSERKCPCCKLEASNVKVRDVLHDDSF